MGCTGQERCSPILVNRPMRKRYIIEVYFWLIESNKTKIASRKISANNAEKFKKCSFREGWGGIRYLNMPLTSSQIFFLSFWILCVKSSHSLRSPLPIILIEASLDQKLSVICGQSRDIRKTHRMRRKGWRLRSLKQSLEKACDHSCQVGIISAPKPIWTDKVWQIS